MNPIKIISRAGVLLILLLSVIASPVNAETLRVGYFKFPPHSMRENGKDVGPAIDYFRLVAEKMNVRDVRFMSLPSSRLFNYLDSGEIDIGLVFAKNPERAARYVYPEQPFGSMVMAIALKESHPLQKIRSVNDILPMKIGYLKKAYLPEMLKDERVKFQFVTGNNWTFQNIMKVRNGRIDAALSDYYSLIYEAKTKNLSDGLKFLKITGTEVALYSIMTAECAEKYLKSYETALEEVKKEKTYAQAFEDILKESFR